MANEHPNWYVVQGGDQDQPNTYVAEGLICNKSQRRLRSRWSYGWRSPRSPQYYVLVTPWNPSRPSRTVRRACRGFQIQRVSPGDGSDVSFVLSGRVTPRHRQLIAKFLDEEGVVPAARDDALALILHLYADTHKFPRESDVRIQTDHNASDSVEHFDYMPYSHGWSTWSWSYPSASESPSYEPYEYWRDQTTRTYNVPPSWYVVGGGDQDEPDTYVAEGRVDGASYYVCVTPWSPRTRTRTIRRGCVGFQVQRVSPGDGSDVSFVLSGRITTRHISERITEFLEREGVRRGVRDAAMTLIMHLYATTINNRFALESDVRIRTVVDHVSRRVGTMDHDSSRVRPRPAPVVSKEALMDALEKLTVDSGELVRETSWAVCLDEFSKGSEVMKMACSHAFHGDCITKWLENRFACPLCRFNELKTI